MGIAEIFGSNVFSESVMRQRLPEREYQEVKTLLQSGGQLSMHTADVVARAMMEWAVEKGATHSGEPVHRFSLLRAFCRLQGKAGLPARRGGRKRPA